ncbi:hypothetical protein BT67DRAFT_442829 [Trichocladium antarcticum]|uniref:Uncharacterized protein n=1 Tax=Trichocladium antarcticum TaxID=1450529 RepID=A0AAN6UKH1_9PEZI|nr:hypothetical protein BT67DRAFT_442829 [Trichocladium antarcticum]
MLGRGRGRPASRSAVEPPAGPSRRSTRNQQQQQNAETQHEDQEQSHPEFSPSQEEQQQDQLQPRLETSMHPPGSQQIIDPAITGPEDAGMHPPPVPSAKNPRGQTISHFARRGTRRDARAPSMVSLNSTGATDAYSSQPEPYNAASQRSPGRVLGMAMRGNSVLSSQAEETPGQKAVRARMMNTMLPRLFDASDDLFSHLLTDQEDLEMWDVERDSLRKPFDDYRNNYVSDESNPFVDPMFVISALRSARAPPSESTILKIVSAANLTSLLDEITPINDEILLPLLQGLDSMFPKLSISEGPDGNDFGRNQQIIDQALMIRTQLSILTLDTLQRESPTPFHPVEQVAKIWCDGDVPIEVVDAFVRNENDAIPLKPIATAGSGLATLAKNRSGITFRAICSNLHYNPTEGFDLGPVRREFDFGDFVENLRAFVEKSFAAIRVSLRPESSVRRDQPLLLAPSDATSRVDSQIRSQLEADASVYTFDRAESGGPSLSYNIEELRKMKQLEQQAPPGYGGGHQLPPNSYAPAPRIPYPPGFGSPTPPPGLIYAESAIQNVYQPDGIVYGEPAVQSTGRKRRSQDDSAAGSAPAAAKKPRARRKKNDVAAPSAAPLSAAAATTSSAAPEAMHSQYPPLPGSQDEPDFDALSQRTREISAATRKAREPQVRSAWVRNDVRMLVKAVDTFSCKWSTIEAEIKAGTIPFERPRDQQALRDKARLLKQDFLKADAILPRGFDYVVLGKKEKEAVRACGKNPDRREGDVDENGQPINTELDNENMLGALPAPLPAPLAPAEPAAEPQAEPQQQVPEPTAV